MTHTKSMKSMFQNPWPDFRRLRLFLWSAGLFAALNLHAANGTWTNTPADNTWSNVLNWTGGVVPGALNQSGNSVNNDVATFNSPIYNGIGGTADPIMPDDATVVGDRSRSLGSIIFDTANCGAYVFYSSSPLYWPGAFTTPTSPQTGSLNLCHNGSITMNPTVTNSETFLVPIFIRLPSSTAGIYNFVNNSTTPTATLFINVVTNWSANTRGTDFILDGSNTGTNTILELDKGTTTSGAMGLTKQGTGTWILPNTNNLASQTAEAINGGTLIVQNAGSLGAPSSATINSNGTLEIDGVNLVQNTLNLQGQGTIRVNGSATVNGVNVGTSSGISGTLATTSSSDVMTVLTNSGGLLNDSKIHVSGPGTVLLTNNGTYAGGWSVDGGTLQIATSSALGSGVNLNVSSGASFDVTPLGTGVTWNPSTSGIGGSGTGTTVGSTAATIKADAAGTIDLATGAKNINLTFSPASTNGDTTHPALYISQGTLSLGNNVFSINNASGVPLGVGTYTLITQATGNIASAGGYSVVVTGSGLASDVLGTIQVSGGNVNLVTVYHVPQPLVWQGGNPNNVWDNDTTANWLNGASLTVFFNSDDVTFNSVGAANSAVSLSGALAPGSVTVDTSANNYTFSGSGSIAGATALTKIGTGTLTLSTVNSYLGGTIISNGVLQVGVNNAVPDGPSGDVSDYGTLDLNALNDTINGLNGTGTVDNTGAGASVLTVGNNDDGGTFSGIIQNTSGTLGLTKAGKGAQTLNGANTFTGPTVINDGTLAVGNLNALADSAVTVNAGILSLGSSLVVSNLTGAFGSSIANNSSANPVALFSHGTSTISSTISDGSGGGPVSVVVLDGAVTLNAANTYSGQTYVASGATLDLGVNNTAKTTGQAGSGGIIASNNATISMPTAVSTGAGPLNNITTVDGATVTFTSGETGNIWGGQFIGSATATNFFTGGNMTFGGVMTFTNFLGTAIITNGEVRIYIHGGTDLNAGGDDTSFVFLNGGGMFTRENEIVHLGSLTGNGVITGNSVAPGNFWIGGKNVNCEYAGGISGSNNIVKVGTGTLLLDGGGEYTTNVTSPDGGLTFVTNVGYGTNMLIYIGSTTVSNGTLQLAVPSELTSSTSVTLAGATATLDASDMGYISNQVTTDGNGNTVTNQFPVTNGVFEVVSGQTLQGMGTLDCSSLLEDSGSTFNIGLPTGDFTITGSAELAGAVTANVNATNSPNSSELLASSITADSTATLVVTNLGPEQAATFQLFNHPVNFTSVTLPTLSGTNSWINDLAVNGSITMVAPQPTPPTPGITHIGVSGTTLTITATNGAINGSFVLLESTNLATPLTNWVPVLTNTFDGSGNLNLSTNVVNPAVPQEFYLLSQ